jgi:cytochrome c553
MRHFLLSIVPLVAGLIGFSLQAEAADISAGKTIVASNCIECHDINGRGLKQGIPNLAAQVEDYLFYSLLSYKKGKREHVALKKMVMAADMSKEDMRNVAAYWASLPPVEKSATKEAEDYTLSYYALGKTLAEKGCATCHGESGISKKPGIPSLAGQQPLYFIAAVQAYVDGTRSMAKMENAVAKVSKADLEKADLQNMALYYSRQLRKEREAPSQSDVKAGKKLTYACTECHGSRGISNDETTPILAAQDPQYLQDVMMAYRDKVRGHRKMSKFVDDFSDDDIRLIAAFYSAQKPKKPKYEEPISARGLFKQCERCHTPDLESSTVVYPKIREQNRGYLINALKTYRDKDRGSETMHKMSLNYSDAIIEGIATLYANKPAR